MKTSYVPSVLFVVLCLGMMVPSARADDLFVVELFPLVDEHAHGATIVELPNGDLLAAWFQGSGERWADDVEILGARLKPGEREWSEPFLMADVPAFPDINPVLFLDARDTLWLVWYTVIANQWETSLLRYRVSSNYDQDGAPEWEWQDVILAKPGDKTERGIQPDDRFVRSVERQVQEYREVLLESGASQDMVQRWEEWRDRLLQKARGEDMVRRGYLYDEQGGRTDAQLGYPYFRRMGWQTKNKPVQLESGRIILPLYSDGFSFSLMAITDDFGEHWTFSEPLVAPGNIQPTIAQQSNGTLVAYMRDNGPPPKRLQVSQSTNNGDSWSTVRDSDIANSGAGSDIVTLENGHWVLANNDVPSGRYRLAISVSTDEGKTWEAKRYLEYDRREASVATRFAYPSIIQGDDGALHVIYSVHHRDRDGANETIKYARFMEEWIWQGSEAQE